MAPAERGESPARRMRVSRWSRRTLLSAMILLLASCRRRPESIVTGDAAPPSPESLCAGGPRDITAVLNPLHAAHDARASELQSLIVGSTQRVIRADGGEALTVEELRRHPSCPPSSEAVLHDRVSRALDALFTKKEARSHGDRRAMVVASVGCEEAGRLLVSLGLGLGVGESVQATYQVDDRSAKLVVDGLALAHGDLDGDGHRDLIWRAPDRHIAVRFTGSERTLKTPLKVPESDDTDYSFAGAPSLESAFALVLAHRTFNGSSEIEERLRWNGKQFVAVDRLTDDGFEARYAAARERELAVLDDSMFGGFGKLRIDLERCANLTTIDAGCATVFENATATLTKGGIANSEARTALRSYLGWQRCPQGSATGARSIRDRE